MNNNPDCQFKVVSNGYTSGCKVISEREVTILGLLAEGFSNTEIANSLYISKMTVENHLKRIFKKLNAKNRTHAAVIAVKNNLI